MLDIYELFGFQAKKELNPLEAPVLGSLMKLKLNKLKLTPFKKSIIVSGTKAPIIG